MSRSGYSDDYEYCNLYGAAVTRAIEGKRGQFFLGKLAEALDAMPVKRLIAHELKDEQGQVCAIGAYCVANKIETDGVDPEDRDQVGRLADIAPSMAAEIEFENDERVTWGQWYGDKRAPETPEQRWVRMRKWVSENLLSAGG